MRYGLFLICMLLSSRLNVQVTQANSQNSHGLTWRSLEQQAQQWNVMFSVRHCHTWKSSQIPLLSSLRYRKLYHLDTQRHHGDGWNYGYADLYSRRRQSATRPGTLPSTWEPVGEDNSATEWTGRRSAGVYSHTEQGRQPGSLCV